MVKLTDETLVDVSFKCLTFLTERCMNEKVLFRTTASLTEVRNLQTSLACNDNNGKSLREELNPYIVLGVLMFSLKSMTLSLMQEIYDDVLKIECTEDFEQIKFHIISSLVNLNTANFDLVCKFLMSLVFKSVFTFLAS